MDMETLCQSCSMPIDNEANRGTEKDGGKSSEYCKYCYQQGAFTTPDITLEEMKKMITEQMQKRSMPADIILKSLTILPFLKRWQTKQQQGNKNL
jgi:hypothetical protein